MFDVVKTPCNKCETMQIAKHAVVLLQRLDLQYNMLTGTFPAALLSSRDLTELRVSGNNLT